jgi:predicted nucleic acid-binding protein
VNSVLLDTSFLITLSDPTRRHHQTALRYYKECISRSVRYVGRFRDTGRMSTHTVLLAEGFDVSWFEAGQHRLV